MHLSFQTVLLLPEEYRLLIIKNCVKDKNKQLSLGTVSIHNYGNTTSKLIANRFYLSAISSALTSPLLARDEATDKVILVSSVYGNICTVSRNVISAISMYIKKELDIYLSHLMDAN